MCFLFLEPVMIYGARFNVYIWLELGNMKAVAGSGLTEGKEEKEDSIVVHMLSVSHLY